MMENYQEKYKKELYQQEINSNIHTLKGFFWIFVTILLLWMLTLVRIFIVDSRIFTMAAGVSAVMGIPVLYIYLCAAVAFGGTVPGKDDTVGYLCRE